MNDESVVRTELPVLDAERVLRGDRRGSSWPVVVETELGQYMTKLRGAAQGVSALVAEVIVGEIAEALGLLVPERCVVRLPHAVSCDDPNDELRDLLDRSAGENIGFEFLTGARDVQPAEAERIDAGFAARVLWLDAFVQNVDRTPRNTNIMVRRGRYWLIDHGIALPFHHDWSGVTEQSPLRPYDASRHLFAWAAARATEFGVQATDVMTRETLTRAVARVPDSLMSGTESEIARRRAAYVAYLVKRARGLVIEA